MRCYGTDRTLHECMITVVDTDQSLRICHGYSSSYSNLIPLEPHSPQTHNYAIAYPNTRFIDYPPLIHRPGVPKHPHR